MAINETLKQAIKTLSQKLKGQNIEWALIGSANLAIQGMNVKPNDIDIITSRKNISRIKQLLKEYSPALEKKQPAKTGKEWIGTDWFYELKLKINNTEVQIIGESEKDIYYSRIRKGRTLMVKIDDFDVPCQTLQAEMEAYEARKRTEKAKMIREFLAKQQRQQHP